MSQPIWCKKTRPPSGGPWAWHCRRVGRVPIQQPSIERRHQQDPHRADHAKVPDLGLSRRYESRCVLLANGQHAIWWLHWKISWSIWRVIPNRLQNGIMCEPTNQMCVACGVPVKDRKMCAIFFHIPPKEATKGQRKGLSENMVPFSGPMS